MARALGDNLRRWREAAEIDWFSHFIKAWIPFNAWMTDTFGDQTDRVLLDRVIGGNNVVYNRIVPMLTPEEDRSQDAEEFRIQVAELHRLLQGCVINGRRGRISFERVDIGENTNAAELLTYRGFTFSAKRNTPTKPQVSVAIQNKSNSLTFSFVLAEYDRDALETERSFMLLPDWQRDKLLSCYEAIKPRIIESALAPPGARVVLKYGNTDFVGDQRKVFKALIDILYGVRNALFHGSITPNEQHNQIYEPAYHICMRLVRCTE
ncbi:hypothetical protein [Herbaspirillum rubrisubalbicans]|uniref:hypothetical protein n=1 Tax=Herbaspirillum rubrisubalbicans TaxID=80842 RepID=UPI0011BEFC28|nr:hypothetical protein [Herbaspirillum rubrisubalbicans]